MTTSSPASDIRGTRAESDGPLVSVLMSVYNAERYLRKAVESLLDQTFRDFELILVNDASTDGSGNILASYDDARMTILLNESNLGLPTSLNRAFGAARGRLIARLDADDIAEPRRLERQVSEMLCRPELDVLGTWTVEIDERGEEIGGFSYPALEAVILWGMARTNVVYHPTVLMRREILLKIGGYRAEVAYAEDYDLFTRILMAGGRIDILPERLIRYRRSHSQISSRRVEQQESDARPVRRAYVAWLTGGEASYPVVEAATGLQGRGDPPPADVLKPALALQLAIQEGAAAHSSPSDRSGRRALREHGRRALLHHARKLREVRRYRDALAVWGAALRTRGGWRAVDVLREGGALLRSMAQP